jgi:poly(A) polymerase
MPLITPTYPCMKCTYNVSEPTQRVITEQIRAGHQACQEIGSGCFGSDALF